MTTISHLVARHLKVFSRDRTLVFFSLLSVLIVVFLYVIFLQKTQISSIEQFVPSSTLLTVMVNEWMSAGLIAVTGMTTTLTAFGIYVRDMEKRTLADFFTTPNSRTIIQLSYVLNAIAIGFILSCVGLLACQIFIILSGGEWFSFIKVIKLLGVIVLSVLLCSAINLLLTLMISSETAFSTLNTIVGSTIGFLCGVYVPLGIVPDVIQKVIMVFPISHTAVLLREILMKDSMSVVFSGADVAKAEYAVNFGVQYSWNDFVVTPLYNVIYILLSFVVFFSLAILLYRIKHK